MRRTGVTEHDTVAALVAAAIVGQRGDKAYVRKLGLHNWNEVTNAWDLVIPNEGSFGQVEAYGTYSSFNTKPKFWGWRVIIGSTGGPNTTSSVWYCGRFALTADYQGGIQDGVGGEYWMEIAVPRHNQEQAGVWTRTCENGAIKAWVAITNPVPVWTTATLENGWVNFAGGFNNAAYRRIGKTVTLRGLVKNGTMGATILTLPMGSRPPSQNLFPVLSNNVIGRIDVRNTGTVVASVGTNAWISLDGVQFSID